tara:strand:+ start:5328 stop:5921 length:594 start_codon:yes stop_codon:yes gene_type:complete
MASLFDRLQSQAFRAGITRHTDRSRQWFNKKVKELEDINRRSLLKDDALKPISNPKSGDMIMYFYDPKWKVELPYYDRFPLTILVGPAAGGFYGLNLHYLSPIVRAKFLDELIQLAPANLSDTTRITRLRYKLLVSTRAFREFKPCWKHYLFEHVKSKMARVPMPDWEVACFLPTQEFRKVKDNTVWRYSRKQYAGG